jgi:nucleoside-diphosphate-sugar epimerase
MGITVAVTGLTGSIGRAAIEVLERDAGLDRILGMARRPFDPAACGWVKTEYRRGDVLDRAAVEALVAESDVVVHLAFLIMGSRAATSRVNLTGTRNVVEATVAAPRPRRLVYTSSVAAYGYHCDNPSPITEQVPVRGSSEHYYSAQKARCEALIAELTAGSGLEVYVLRPCIVVGPGSTTLADSMPWKRLNDWLPAAARRAAAAIPGPWPLLPDPGIRLQLVHPDDVAAAIAAAVAGRGAPGAYNLAGDGDVSLGQMARTIGAHPVRIPGVSVRALSLVLAHLPYIPQPAQWLHTLRTPMLVDTSKAKRELGWRPTCTSAQTLDALEVALATRQPRD